jgi:predicted aconitase with swiveling domain
MTHFLAATAMGKRVRGRALVAKDGFSARYDLDRAKGLFSRPEHSLAGRSYVGRVLVLDAAKGGVATAWMLHEMAARGVMPTALALNRLNPIMVQGAAFADFTLISGFAVDITAAVPDGALVDIDPESDPPCLRILAPS